MIIKHLAQRWCLIPWMGAFREEMGLRLESAGEEEPVTEAEEERPLR